MKHITTSDDYIFVEDAEGRLIRKRRAFRNIIVIIFFIAIVIGSAFCAISSAFQEKWSGVFASLPFLIFPAITLIYLWRLRKIPKLTFDKNTKTLILQKDGKEERLDFAQIKQLKIRHRPMDDGEGVQYRNHSHYDVIFIAGEMGIIKLATFSGKTDTTSEKAKNLVSMLKNLVNSE